MRKYMNKIVQTLKLITFLINALTLFILDTSKQILWQTVKTHMECRIRPALFAKVSL